MKRNIFAAAFLIILTNQSFSQSLRQPITAIYAGLAAYSTQQGDVLSYLNNQAALVQVKNVAAGVYGQRRYY